MQFSDPRLSGFSLPLRRGRARVGVKASAVLRPCFSPPSQLFPASATGEGRLVKGGPFPATVWAEGRQFNGVPSSARGKGLKAQGGKGKISAEWPFMPRLALFARIS